jgi:hypothetical protein
MEIEVSPLPVTTAPGATVSTDPAGFTMLMEALAESDEFDVLVACTVTVLGEGGTIGGV